MIRPTAAVSILPSGVTGVTIGTTTPQYFFLFIPKITDFSMLKLLIYNYYLQIVLST
jgi:hypothetical protein